LRLVDRETERQKDRKTERQKDRKTERQKDRKTKRQKDRKTKRQKHRKTGRKRGMNTISSFQSESINIFTVGAAIILGHERFDSTNQIGMFDTIIQILSFSLASFAI
jgi:F0F1-type ATP synthase assembly protein I